MNRLIRCFPHAFTSILIQLPLVFKTTTGVMEHLLHELFQKRDSPSAPASLRWGAVPWLRGLRVGLVALWWPKLCVPTVLPSVENGLLGRGLWDKPLPAGGIQEPKPAGQ